MKNPKALLLVLLVPALALAQAPKSRLPLEKVKLPPGFSIGVFSENVPGALYVAEISRVLRFDGIDGRLKNPPKPVVVTDAFPKDRHHGWKFIRFGPDGALLVPDDEAGAVYRITHGRR